MELGEIPIIDQHAHNLLKSEFIANYPLDIAPQSDGRPFPGRLLKWSQIGNLYKSTGSRFYGMFLSGEIVVMVVLAEALLVTALLLLAPLRFLRQQPVTAPSRSAIYFFGLGSGFMFLEIYLIHLATFLLGDPVIGFSFILTALLISSGTGGLVSKSWPMNTVRMILPLLFALIAIFPFGWRWLSAWSLELPISGRLVMIVIMLFPLGFLMGVPFPLGMRHMTPTPATRAYAWSVNGCASVLSVIFATQLTISFGLDILLMAALIAYGVSFMCGFGFNKPEPTVDNAVNHGNNIGQIPHNRPDH